MGGRGVNRKRAVNSEREALLILMRKPRNQTQERHELLRVEKKTITAKRCMGYEKNESKN
jgi:hypothetical protein